MFTLSVTDDAGFAPKKVSRSTPAKLRILMVEDDEADAYLIKRLLMEHPRIAEVYRAVDGVEALEMLSIGMNPDLAFIDLKMPRMNGYSLVSEIAAKRLRFPMIVLTSLAAPSDSAKRALRRADQILSKPANMLQMRNLLGKAIAGIEA